MPRRRILFVLGAVVVVVLVVVGLSQSGADNGAPEPDTFDLAAAQRTLAGAPAPLAALHAQSNQLIPATRADYDRRLAALKGHPIVVNKWASWCPPCRGEFPVLQATSTRFGKQVAFIGLDASDNDGDASAFLRHFPVPYPSLVDRSSRIAQALGIGRTFPTTIYYDARGKVQYIHQGPYTSDAAFATDIRRYALGQPK
ncbi:MAG TPA: TlpA disulfide reductase family protein [Baekduia sp.]|nr:TlpA disulfide reductase family protein [Baekduia sp.]